MRAGVAALLLSACQVRLDYAGTSYACGPEGACPEGTACVEGRCVGAGPPADGASSDAPATAGDGAPDGPPGPDAPIVDAPPLPRCGDGLIRPFVETCDDGNTADGDACPSTCRACDGVLFAGHCYQAFTTPLAWDAARADCEARGGHLATLTSAEEDAAVGPLEAAGMPWFGLHEPGVEGSWAWVTGEPFAYTQWNVDEPNDSGGVEDCAQYYVLDTWNDNDCTVPYEYVCEDDGWAIRPEDAHAYRVIWGPLDAAGAASACAALGGHVATIGSAEEQAFVAPLATLELRLGMTDAATEGAFVWQTGEPMTFTNWANGEPDDTPNGADCGAIRPGGEWIDARCGSGLPVLCEVE